MKFILITLASSILLLSFVLAGDKEVVASRDVGEKIEIIGDLGVPVGKTVTITGRKERNGPLANWFWVETVDGKKKEIGIQIEGISDWPDGTKATLSGIEFATLQYFTEPYGNMTNNDSRWKGPKQLLSLEFKVERIVSPANLHLKN